MQNTTGDETRVYRSKVDASGRIALPADLRLRQHINTGDQVVIIENDDGLRLRTLDQAIHDAREVFATLAPANVVLSDELIRERHAEGEHE